MAVPGELHALIERLDRDLPSYRSAGFNEAQARIDFINPLLGLLGWDVENRRKRLPTAVKAHCYTSSKMAGALQGPGLCLAEKVPKLTHLGDASLAFRA